MIFFDIDLAGFATIVIAVIVGDGLYELLLIGLARLKRSRR